MQCDEKIMTPTGNRSILVIGNGLSTRYLAHVGFDKIPKNIDTFGMGAAYRYYLDIGWWPTYYALCDVKVVFYHQTDLKRIIEDPEIPVRKYFFPLRISGSEKLEVIPHSSTGVFCVQKAIELGYKKIFIIGIETDYIERIKESRQLTPEEIDQIGLGQLEEFKKLPLNSRVILMLTKTPLVNTNYFFDSYQREGDIYSLPSGQSHYSKWQQLAQSEVPPDVEIINLSPASPLEMFAKGNLDDFLNAKTYHTLPATKPSNTTGHSSRKASKTPTRLLSRDVKKGRSLYRRLVDYLKRNYPTMITIGRFGIWSLAKLKKTFFGIGGIALMVIVGLYIAGALVEPLRWYLVGIASALLLLCGGLLALFYARSTLNRVLNRIISEQSIQVSNINNRISDINKKISDINKKVSDIKKEVAPYNEVNQLRLERVVRIEKQVEITELQHDLRDSKPILFFNATSGPAMLGFASTAGLIISWALRLSGHRVIHLVCRKGLRRCIQGTNRYELNKPMPCETCYAIKNKMFPQDLRWYLETKSEAPSALIPLGSYSLDDLTNFVYQGIKIGELCTSSVRWTLRRHRLDSDPRSTRLLREYIRGGMNIVDTLPRLLQEQELHSMVVFNGVFYPEAIAREVALQKGLPVVAYEISIPGLKVFLSHGVAAGGGLITIPEDFQMSAAQEADFDRYMSQRIRGNVGQPGLWPEMKGIEPDLQAFTGQYKNVVSVFTNVIFDTSQYGAHTVFESMFDWLDEIIKLASLHPETLFVVRAHPAEVLPRHESEELVGDWLKEHSYLATPNIRFIPPTDYISSYELLNISRFCLVYNSTIGLEAVVLGIPTITAAAGRYSGAGVTHAPASREAYRELVETFLKNGPPPVVDTVRQRARYYMYQLCFRQGLDFSAFLEAPDWTLKPIDASALHPDNSPEMNIIYKGIMEGGPFYYPP